MNRIHKYNKPCTFVLVDKNGNFSELTWAAGLNIFSARMLQSTQLFHDTSCKDVLEVYCTQDGEVTFSFKRTATQDAFIACHKALCKHFEGRLSVEAVNGLMKGLRWFYCVTFLFL